MKYYKTAAFLSAAAAMLLSLQASAEDGTYMASAHGNNGPVYVTLQMKDDEIADVQVDENLETPGLGAPAALEMGEKILSEQSLSVDTVAGATISSRAVLEAAALALETAGYSPEDYKNAPAEMTVEEKNTDVVIVGGGLAGMVSAVRAAQEGVSVILIERSGVLGGEARYAMGWISGAGTNIQESMGIEDSPELFYEDIVGFADGEENLNVPTAKYYTENSGAAIDWLQENGVAFKEELNPGIYDPMSVLRVAWGERMGQSLVAGMQEKLDAYTGDGQVEVLLNTSVNELLTDENGAVTGVKASDGNNHEITVHAGSTILATGGYEANEEILSGMFENVVRSFMTTSDGSTIELAKQAGAGLHDMDYNAVNGGVLPNDGFYSNIYMDTTYGGLIYVDVNGNRVFDEMTQRNIIRSNAWVDAPENTLYAILTEDMIDRETPILSQGNAWMSTKDTEYALFDELTEQGELIVKADSIEELAEKTGLSGLPATVESYNEGAADGKDEQFGRTEKLEPLTDGPFYAIRTIPYCGWAAGGPMANENMEVLREDGSVIPGLYVAGEGAGFTLVSGKTPISGMYLGMASTFGIDAAVHAAEFAQKQ